ncbi:M23 family metallopeptidase [Nesterenkonia sp. NBAIMH1]|uniref:M23 family metallopeptidase n=1 Tax=Nesterenkonia sp. NBAIMH1 TaxID=2600320 RepID=UPI001AEFDD4C|nr:M23 family metallopeptidase [Nesterenkonia sp. NBAIMH1]
MIARLRRLWTALLMAALLSILADMLGLISPPGGFVWVLAVIGAIVLLSAAMGVAPRAPVKEPVEVAAPVRGRWIAVNSPGQKIPSHGGARSRGQLSAADITHPTHHEHDENPPLVRRGWRGSRPEEFTCFGAPIRAMADGTVTETADGQRDQRARNTWPTLLWMMTVEGAVRELLFGYRGIFGNRVVIAHDDGTCAAYAHLKRGSVTVRPGQRVAQGDLIGRLGNTGNTSMPHLHVQLMDHPVIDAAAGIPMRWTNIELEDIDPQWQKHAKAPERSALEGMPRDGQIFRAL